MAGPAVRCWAVTGLCSFAQNILGLRGIPRQFFLQVYETFRRIGETRSATLVRPFQQSPSEQGARLESSQHPGRPGHPLTLGS